MEIRLSKLHFLVDMRAYSLFIMLMFWLFLPKTPLKAQEITAIAGINQSDLLTVFSGPSSNIEEETLNGSGYGARMGVEFSIPLSEVLNLDLGFLVAERRGYKEITSTGILRQNTLLINTIDVPVNLRLAFNTGDFKWHVRAGVMGGMAMNASQESVINYTTISRPAVTIKQQPIIGSTNNLKRIDLGSYFAAGVTWDRYSLQLSRLKSLSSIINEPEGSEYSYHWIIWNLSLGCIIAED